MARGPSTMAALDRAEPLANLAREEGGMPKEAGMKRRVLIVLVSGGVSRP